MPTPELTSVMEQLKTSLASAYPSRHVTRSLRDFNDIERAQLLAGVYTLVAGRESDFPNYRGREGNFGTLEIEIYGQIEIAEASEGKDIEDAESAMVDEIKAFTRGALPAPIDSLVITEIGRSRQLERPYGWVGFACEVQLQ